MAHDTSISSLTSQPPKGDPWIIDSDASDHMTGTRSLFRDYFPYHGDCRVKLADGSFTCVAGHGTVWLNDFFCLSIVLYVSSLSCNPLSISKVIVDLCCLVKFSPPYCIFQDQHSGRMIGRAKVFSGLYYFMCDLSTEVCCNVIVGSSSSLHHRCQVILLHYRLRHPSFSYMRRLFPNLISNNDSFKCEVCLLAKHTRVSFPIQHYWPFRPFSLIHNDLWGPSRVNLVSNKRWFISFIDDHTRVCWVYLLYDKSKVAMMFENFYTMISTQYDSKIQFLRTNNGTEYFNETLNNSLLKKGMLHQSFCVNTPQQNGVSERKNCHFLEISRSLLFALNVPKRFWGDALLIACFLINRMPSKVLQFQTPLQTLQKYSPENCIFSKLDLHIFGCTAFVHLHDPSLSKVDARSCKCIFLGYSSVQKGYRCYSFEKRKYFVSKDVTFIENTFFFKQNPNQGEMSLCPVKDSNFQDQNTILDLNIVSNLD